MQENVVTFATRIIRASWFLAKHGSISLIRDLIAGHGCRLC